MNPWCKGCVWATDVGGKTFCPFVEGSCVKIAGSIDKPDPYMLKERVHFAANRGIIVKEKEE